LINGDSLELRDFENPFYKNFTAFIIVYMKTIYLGIPSRKDVRRGLMGRRNNQPMIIE
jgi:hypothetical protein